jgi:hypothetical protein
MVSELKHRYLRIRAPILQAAIGVQNPSLAAAALEAASAALLVKQTTGLSCCPSSLGETSQAGCPADTYVHAAAATVAEPPPPDFACLSPGMAMLGDGGTMGGEATNKGREWRADGGKRRELGWGMAGDGIERGRRGGAARRAGSTNHAGIMVLNRRSRRLVARLMLWYLTSRFLFSGL